MKDRILKLCKRLKNCTLNDITQLMDIEPSVLEVILLFLINENKIQEKDGIYSVIEELPTKNGIESKNLKLMFMYHSPETVDLIMRSFCAELPTIKVSYLTGVGDNCICDFYKIFRNLIYERQLNVLVNHYCKNPQKFRFMVASGSVSTFLRVIDELESVTDSIFNLIKLTQQRLEQKLTYTQEEEQEFKKIYCYLARIESHNQNEVYLYQRLAESIWRREKSFEELYSDLKNNLIS